MFQRKPRRFRRRSNGRGHLSRENGYMQARLRTNSFSNTQTRNNFKQTQSAEELFEKYNTLAKEAMSTGDKTLGENYFQHADHFMRIIENKNKNKDQSKDNIINKTVAEDKPPSEDSNIKQEDVTKNKE
tara:strand:+ start:3460 stop:3846 length:387 start_codon:yes stop_codon:yes gene_type:complete